MDWVRKVINVRKLSENTMVLDLQKFNKISLLASERTIPRDMKFILFNENSILRVAFGNVMNSNSINEIASLGISRYDRGKIISAFTKLENLINEILIIKIIGFNKSTEAFDNYLSDLTFSQRIKLVKFHGLMDKDTKEKLWNLKEVRNGFAHKWTDMEIYYKGEPIRNAILSFLEDMKFCWNKLKEAYTNSIEDKEIEELIRYLETLPKRGN